MATTMVMAAPNDEWHATVMLRMPLRGRSTYQLVQQASLMPLLHRLPVIFICKALVDVAREQHGKSHAHLRAPGAVRCAFICSFSWLGFHTRRGRCSR